MAINIDINLFGQSPWRTRGILALIFTGIAVAYIGVVLNVEYRWMKVQHIQPLAGQSSWSRAVLVETPERMRLIRTSDPLLVLEVGHMACVSKQTVIARRWVRYGLALPGYCRQKRDMLPGINAAPLPRSAPSP